MRKHLSIVTFLLLACLALGAAFQSNEQVTSTKLNNLNNANITSSAGIDPEKIDDLSATTTEQDATSDPYVGDSQVLATDLEDEVQQLRFQVEQFIQNYLGSSSTAKWYTDPVFKYGTQFNNHVKNGSFEDSALPVANTPSGWALNGTPTAAIETTIIAPGYGSRGIKITGTGAANEGLKQTLTGLKASTTYSILCYAAATSGDTASIITIGADTEASISVTATTMTRATGSFITDGSATDVSLRVVAASATDVVFFDNVIVVEGFLPPAFAPHLNDEHLKAIDYQDTTPTNIDYSSLRMECGVARAVFLNSTNVKVTVTYGTAFTKILSATFTPCMGSVNGIVATDLDNVFLDTVPSATTMVPQIRNDAADWASGDYIDVYWIAIGVD